MSDTAAIIPGPAILTWLVVSLTALAYIFLKGYQRRASFNRLRRQGLPMPPWNPFLGHLLALSPVLAKLPSDTQQPGAFEILCKSHEKKDGESLIYLDLWPFAADPLLVICSPTLAVQACQDHDLLRPEILHKFFDPLAGGDNLFTMNGPEWKRSRALFNPGFSSSYILQQFGQVVDEATVYASKLREHSRQGDLFSLDKMTCWYTMDIIGAVTLNSRRLHSQTRFNPLASAMRRQIRWHVLDNEFNLLVRWNPARPIVQAYNNWQMNRYISRELDKRYAEWIDDQDITVAISSSRSIIDIVLAEYMAQQQQNTKTTRPK
ncbi:cytochrome P450 [Podospora australis]|uniref:Cytochrome P450 n=1 Tax=Podospora australis TaxID=1536484 RepID=A0AAN7AD59_9PEZI|nr:cytochrome P450 [Podospora australis]